MDDSTVTRSYTQRSRVSVPHSRSALDVLLRSGRGRGHPWAGGREDTFSSTAGERILRATDRNDAERVFGFHDSAQRTPSTCDCSRMGFPLQPRPSSLPFRAGNSRSEIGTLDRAHRHRLEEKERITSTSVLGGLHHEYALERTAA